MVRHLASIVILTLSCAAVVIWYAPDLTGASAPKPFSFSLERDPKPGLSLPRTFREGRDVLGRELPSSANRTLVVAGGSCSGCSVKAVAWEKLPTSEFDHLFVFYQASTSDIANSIPKPVPDNVFIISDGSTKLEDDLNAQWTGRWYEFANDRLLTVQLYPTATNWSRRGADRD